MKMGLFPTFHILSGLYYYEKTCQIDLFHFQELYSMPHVNGKMNQQLLLHDREECCIAVLK